MNELVKHLEFFEPADWIRAMLGTECFSKEIQEIFFLARSIFSSHSVYSIKESMAPILNRKKPSLPSSKDVQKRSQSPRWRPQPLSDNMDIAKVSWVYQIASVLPREFVINHDTIFYKKLINKELNRRRFEAPEEETLSTTELVHGQDQRVNKAQKIYVLFDNSSSMSGEKLNKFYAAKAISLEYLRRAQPENPQIYFRSFTDQVSPLIRSERAKDIKKIIRHIAHLHTADCYQTEIGKAILQAIEDIRRDPRMEKAEILVITDGLGPIPENLRELLGGIKLHVILICGLDIDQVLKLYPDRAAWDLAGQDDKPREMPAFWSAWNLDRNGLSLPDPGENLEALRKSKLTPQRSQMLRKMEILLALAQVYQLQEIVDTFIPLPSILGEKFDLFNAYELELIIEYRKTLEQNQHQHSSIPEKTEIYHRIHFMIRYLNNLLSRKPSQEMQEQIRQEINHFIRIKQILLKDSWFVSILENFARQGEGITTLEEEQEKGIRSHKNRKGLRTFLIILGRKIKRLYHWVMQSRPWLVNLIRYWIACLKRKRLIRRKNKLRDKLRAELGGVGS
ncbi:MAG: VWA domain-containing protein [bacterium]